MQVAGARLQAKYAPAYESKVSSWAGTATRGRGRAPFHSAAAPTGLGRGSSSFGDFAAPPPALAAPQLMKQDLSNSQV